MKEEIEIGQNYTFKYLNSTTKEWEEKSGIARVASAEHQTLLLGTILYFKNKDNNHIKDLTNTKTHES